jgi:hypothetical protein
VLPQPWAPQPRSVLARPSQAARRTLAGRMCSDLAATRGLCRYCHGAVPANTSIATAHLLCQCEATPPERRQWFRQQLQRGSFAVIVADGLPPHKRAQYDGGNPRPHPPLRCAC